jgi:hypothetical protein
LEGLRTLLSAYQHLLRAERRAPGQYDEPTKAKILPCRINLINSESELSMLRNSQNKPRYPANRHGFFAQISELQMNMESVSGKYL